MSGYEKAIHLLDKIIQHDLNYRDAANLKGKYTDKLNQRREDERKAQVKAFFDLAIENAKKLDFSQTGFQNELISHLQKIVSLDNQYQHLLKKINDLFQDYEEKISLGDDLMNQDEFDEADQAFKECEKLEATLPDQIQTILKQSLSD